ncbi:MAG: MFS transporter [Acidobacteria bacterium]|nr:MFS transporter [Acidobacteriota bacterium]
MKKTYYGWWVTAAAFVTFGLSVGWPYYNISFFYDYFAKPVEQGGFGWSRADITFGFPLAAVLTIWAGPLLVPRFSPRKLIVVGTGLTCLAFLAFGNMGGNIWIYWGIWVLYTVGYILSGPIPHQIIISQWFRRMRGRAMGVLYVGVGLIGFLGSFLVKPLTETFDYHNALMIMGVTVLLAWPLALLVHRDRPAEKNLFPDGAATPPPEISIQSYSFRFLLNRWAFWLLLAGSACSIGSIGAVNFHMKFVFLDQMQLGPQDPQFQGLLNSTWRAASMIILASSIAGRLAIGLLFDKLNKKLVMVVAYFLSALTIPILLTVEPPTTPWVFSLLFGFAMGADYMLIPLMAAELFGVNSLARCMAIILPVNTITQTWFPYLVSVVREQSGSYWLPMGVMVFGVALMSGVCIALLPRRPVPEQVQPAKA